MEDLDHRLEPLDVPAHLLRAAYLLGKIPFRATCSDPRVSYSLYIPEQYKEVHSFIQCQRNQKSEPITPYSTTPSQPRKLPLVVNVHGTRRDATRCRDSLVPLADTLNVAILAPLYPAGLDGEFDLDSYKTLRSKTLKADVVLLAIIAEVAKGWPGIATERVVLMGFSGGAQFVQRMLYVWPERIMAVLIAAPGRTTALGGVEPWPHGTRDFAEVFEIGDGVVDVETMRGIGGRIGLFVGELDGEEAQKENLDLQKWLTERIAKTTSSGEYVKRLVQGKGRLFGLKELQQDWRRHGIESTLEVVPGVGHDYQGLLAAMTDWLMLSPVLADQRL